MYLKNVTTITQRTSGDVGVTIEPGEIKFAYDARPSVNLVSVTEEEYNAYMKSLVPPITETLQEINPASRAMTSASMFGTEVNTPPPQDTQKIQTTRKVIRG